MAKELPFFKFEPSMWETGNIQLCSFEAQGVFINVCSVYWQRIGDLSYKLAAQKVCNGNATALDSLISEEIIKVIDGMICIDFLNEQLSEFENISSKNSENARSGWEKRKNNATSKRPHSDRNAIREEKKREEKIREDNKKDIPLRAFVDDKVNDAWTEWVQYLKEKKKKITPSTAKKQINFLGGRAGPEAIEIINKSITNGWVGLFDLTKQNHVNGNTSKTAIRRADATIEQPVDYGNF